MSSSADLFTVIGKATKQNCGRRVATCLRSFRSMSVTARIARRGLPLRAVNSRKQERRASGEPYSRVSSRQPARRSASVRTFAWSRLRNSGGCVARALVVCARVGAALATKTARSRLVAVRRTRPRTGSPVRDHPFSSSDAPRQKAICERLLGALCGLFLVAATTSSGSTCARSTDTAWPPRRSGRRRSASAAPRR